MADDGRRPGPAEWVAEHHEAVYRYAFRLSGSVADAEDLTQQVFLAAYEKRDQLRQAGSVRSWLFSILRHCFSKSCEKRRATPAGNIQLNLESIPAEPPTADAIDQQRLQEALDLLPPPYRLVLAMFYFEGCSYRQIAEKLDLPIGTVMSRLARAKGHLRAYLFDADGRAGQKPARITADRRGL
ncbi:MAG: RNA polymerase sigma factor [Thermoguttaceae bacterium]